MGEGDPREDCGDQGDRRIVAVDAAFSVWLVTK